MKVDALTFNRYAAELHLEGLLSEGDRLRVRSSLEAKGDGFINDLMSLANCIRLALSRKYFKLDEHTNRVFARIHGSVLPRFLGGALRKVFTDTGEVRESYDVSTAAQLLMFCDALKRTDPQPHRRPTLESQLWSGLEARFAESSDRMQAVALRAVEDEDFRRFFKRVRLHFRSVLQKVDMSRLEFGTGPGKNLDRVEASTAPDWYQSFPTIEGPASRDITLGVFRHLRRIPYASSRQRDVWRYGGTRLDAPTGEMHCSAQPKSNKALRGVGVMHAGRMAEQITLQRMFYRDCLCLQMPLRDQDEMARNLSENWEHIGTIDLSNASDRAYWTLLKWLGNGIPWFDAAYELRTRTLLLPTGSIECAAPVMGEAITFPLLSLLMYSIAMATCDEHGGGHEYVRIYGDDIQTSLYYETILRLEQCGMEVSKGKSYPPDSYFKESCEAHYVFNGRALRACRPAFLFSARLNFRNRVNHVDAYRLLVLAKDAFMRNSILSKVCCDVVESHTALRLPLVPYGSQHLGRPTLAKKSTTELDVVGTDGESLVLSQRGALRLILKKVNTDSPDNLKLSRKQEYLMTLRTLKKLQVRDTMRDLENLIMYRVATYCMPEKVAELEERGCNHQDIKSYLLQHASEDDILAGLTLIREMVLQVKFK